MNDMKFFLDLGSHHLEGLDQIVDKYKIDSSWIIHTFEPNPQLKEKITEGIKQRKNLNIHFHNVAVGEADAEVRYEYCHHSMANNTRNWFPNTVHDYKIVPQIDFSHFLETLNIKERDFVVCKCDIEGSEFYLLDHLIEKGTIELIDHLYIEFHAENQCIKLNWPHHLSDKQIKRFKNIKNQINTLSSNLKIFKWD